MHVYKKKSKLLFLFIIQCIFISFSIFAGNSDDEIEPDVVPVRDRFSAALVNIGMDPGSPNEEKAEKIFQICLQYDQFAIQSLYFKEDSSCKEEAYALLRMISVFYKMILQYDSNHPYAQLFYDAHPHMDDTGLPVNGDPTAQIAVSGLYADGDDNDVPDSPTMESFWIMQSHLTAKGERENTKKAISSQVPGTCISFSAKELSTFLGAIGAGIVTGFGAGQAMVEIIGGDYWLPICTGIGGLAGVLSWISGIKLYDLWKWWYKKRQKKADKESLENAFEDNEEDAVVIAMEEGQAKPTSNKTMLSDNQRDDIVDEEELIGMRPEDFDELRKCKDRLANSTLDNDIHEDIENEGAYSIPMSTLNDKKDEKHMEAWQPNSSTTSSKKTTDTKKDRKAEKIFRKRLKEFGPNDSCVQMYLSKTKDKRIRIKQEEIQKRTPNPTPEQTPRNGSFILGKSQKEGNTSKKKEKITLRSSDTFYLDDELPSRKSKKKKDKPASIDDSDDDFKDSDLRLQKVKKKDKQIHHVINLDDDHSDEESSSSD